MPRAFAYCRKSPCPESLEQKINGGMIDSLEQQEQLCLAKLQRLADEGVPMGAAPVKEHESAALVGWRERKEFVGLLSQMQPGDHLVVWRLDRLESNYFRLMDLLNRLVEQGIEIHVLQFMEGQPIDLSSAMGRVMVGILAMARDMWIEMLRAATRDAQAVRLKGGQGIAQHPPWGRRWVEIDRKTRRSKPMRLCCWDEKQVALLNELFERREINRERWCSIARDWLLRQERTPSGIPWARYRVQYVSHSNQKSSRGGAHKIADDRMRLALKWLKAYRARGGNLPTSEQIAACPWTTAETFPSRDAGVPFLAAGLQQACGHPSP